MPQTSDSTLSGTETISDSAPSVTSDICHSISSSQSVLAAQPAKTTPSSSKEIVSLTVQLAQTTTEEPVSLALLLKDGMELIVLTDVTLADFGTLAHQLVSAQSDNSGTDLPALSVPTEELGTPILNLASALSHQLGMASHVSPVLEEECITTSQTNVNAPMAKISMDSSVLSTAQLDNSTTKQSKDVSALLAKTGMETSAYSVSVDKPGTLPSILVFVQMDQSGMDMHVLIHAQEEEFWMPSVVNASAQLVTGTVLVA